MGAHRIQNAAFTLIELLVVITIIAILSGLLIGIMSVRERAAEMVTQARMHDVIRLIQATGSDTGGAAFHLASSFRLIHSDFNEVRDGLYEFSDNAAYRDFVDSGLIGYFQAQATTPANFVFESPWHTDPNRTMSEHMTPAFSFFFFFISGLLPENDPTTEDFEPFLAYFNDRSPDRSWNDNWGQPLVVAHQLFQPALRQDLVAARQTYGYSRSLYLSIGSAGSSHGNANLVPGDVQNPIRIWDFIMDTVAEERGPDVWDGDDFGVSSWQGINAFRTGNNSVLLSAPSERR